MSVAYEIPSDLRKSLGDKASSQFVDVLNDFGERQRNGFERTLAERLNATKETFKEFVDRRIAESEARSERRFSEIEVKIAQSQAILEARIDTKIAQTQSILETKIAENQTVLESKITHGIAELESKMSQNKAELEGKMAQNQADIEGKMAQYHISLLRWMLTFFIGTVIALGGLLFTFVQLLVK